MEFKLLINQLDTLDLPRDQCVIVGSGTLGALNIRESKDLDIVPVWDLWEDLVRKHKVTDFEGIENINVGDVQFLGKGTSYRNENIATLDEMINTALIIDGHRFLNLDLVKKFKLHLGREKDLKDIELIDKYLADHG